MSLIRKHNISICPYSKSDYDDEGNPIDVFDTPFIIENVTLNSLDGSTDIQMFGDRIKKMCKTLVDYDKYLGKIKEKDLAYLYGADPYNEKVNGNDANYEVTAVLPRNKKIVIYFELRVGKE